MDYKFSHVGIPVGKDRQWDGYYEPGKVHYTDFTNDEFNIEFVHMEEDSPWPEMMKTMAHTAYLVDNIEEALEGREILLETFSPAPGVRVAFIIHEGAPVEFMEVSE
ncbi:MAG: hypothetical protein AB3N63_06435 [Puniceicoccaceae bacterium]